MFRAIFSRKAAKSFLKIPMQDAGKIKDAVIKLQKKSDIYGVIKLKIVPVGHYRYRVGKYRIIFDTNNKNNTNELLIMKSMPKGTQNLFREDFIRKTLEGKNRFSKELKKNSAYDWAPKSQTCFYNSKGDELVVYETMVKTYNHMKNLGGNVEMKEIPGGLSHSAAIVPGIYEAKAWFDSLFN